MSAEHDLEVAREPFLGARAENHAAPGMNELKPGMSSATRFETRAGRDREPPHVQHTLSSKHN